MTAERHCRRCGAPVPPDAPQGSCPACLLRAGLGWEDEEEEEVEETERESGCAEAATDGPSIAFGESVLGVLGETVGSVPRVVLHETEAWQEKSDDPTITPDVPASHDFSSRYELFGVIARGGMGAILKGRDTDLGRDLAVKVLLDQHRDKPQMLRRFIEEAQIGGQLQHPGILPVYELGTFPDHRPYFTMKLVKGRTLADLLADRATLDEDRPRFLGIFEQICQTMAYTHARGVLHRDLKPSNIMVGSFGEVQVMDWGLAKVLPTGGLADELPGETEREMAIQTSRTSRETDASMAGSVMGTPAYMAPEQARGEVDRLDERVDVFAIGAMLCEILTGRPPYTGTTSVEIQKRAARADLDEALRRLDASGAEDELIAIAKSCLAAEPSKRPRDAGTVAGRVAGYWLGVEHRLHEAELESELAQARAEGERKRRRLEVGLAASVAALVLLGVGGWLSIERGERARRARWVEQVQTALDEANRLGGEAKGRGESDPAAWERAVSAAEKAEGLLRAGGDDHDPAWRSRVETTLVRLREGRSRAAKAQETRARDRRLVETIEANRLSLPMSPDGSYDYPRWIAKNLSALRDYGLDIQNLPDDEAVRLVQSSAVRNEIIAVLDDMTRRAIGSPKARFLAIARRADPDPFRDRLRVAMAQQDADELKRLAVDPEATVRLSCPSLTQLADGLCRAGAREEAATLLRAASAVHPTDFWIHTELADLLPTLDPPRLDEAALHAMAAVTLKPKPGAMNRLGTLLMSAGRPNEAQPILHRAMELSSGSAENQQATRQAAGLLQRVRDDLDRD